MMGVLIVEIQVIQVFPAFLLVREFPHHVEARHKPVLASARRGAEAQHWIESGAENGTGLLEIASGVFPVVKPSFKVKIILEADLSIQGQSTEGKENE